MGKSKAQRVVDEAERAAKEGAKKPAANEVAGEALEAVATAFTNESPVPPFPTEALDPISRAFVEAGAKALDVPVDLVAVPVLTVMAAALQKKIKVQMKQDHIEPVSLFGLTLKKSGGKKSASQGLALGPMVEWEGKKADEAKTDAEVSWRKHQALNKRVNHLTDALAEVDASQRAEAEEALEQAVRELAEFKLLRVPRLTTSDVTVEKLARLMHEHDERMGVFSAESRKLLAVMGGRYSGGVPDFDLFLHSHAADRYTFDRVVLNGVPLVLHQPALTLGMMGQRSVLPKLRELDEGSGLFARFLISIPDGKDAADEVLDAPDLPRHISDSYQRLICRMLDFDPGRWDNGSFKSLLLKPTREALERYQDFRRDVNIRRSERLEGDLAQDERLSEWAAKFHGAVARFGGLLVPAMVLGRDSGQLTDSTEITVDAMDRAIKIGNYFAAHELRACDVSADTRTQDHAKKILLWACRKALRGFDERMLANSGPSPRDDKKLRREALDLLEIKGLITSTTPDKEKNRAFGLTVRLASLSQRPSQKSQVCRNPVATTKPAPNTPSEAMRAGSTPDVAMSQGGMDVDGGEDVFRVEASS